MNVVAVAVTGLALVVVMPKWLRVSQREHYIPGSCLTTARRWARVRSPNGAIASAAAAGLVTSAVLAVVGSAGASAAAAAAGAGLAAVFPWPMSILGRGKRLVMTRRARTLLAAVAGLVALLVGLGTAAGNAPSALAAASVLMPAMVDAASAMVLPLERRALEAHRRRAERRLSAVAPWVVAITGSFGKTSTKQHVRDLIAGSRDVVATPASWNNTAGLSRAVNEHLTDGAEVFVAEMGMYGPGEIRELCSWVRPDVAVITSIGPMHLERVGSIEGIAEAKAEILERAEHAVLWVDDPRLDALAAKRPSETTWRVGSAGGRDLDVEVQTRADHIEVRARGQDVGCVPATSGLHPGNVGCAVAAALASGIPRAHVASRLPTLSSPDHRSSSGTTESGLLVIDDTFNANPVGARAAVTLLSERVANDRAVITPGMVELGFLQEEMNRELAAHVVDSGAQLVIVGWTNRRALLAGSGGRAVLVRDRAEAAEWVRANLGEGDGVLWENDLPDHYP